MSNLLHLSSNSGRATDKGTTFHGGDMDRTVLCGLFPWKIPRVRLGSFFHSLQGRLHGQERTLVTALNVQQSPVDQGGDQKQTAAGSRRWSLFRKPNKVQPIERVAFGGSSESSSGHLRSDKSRCHKTGSVVGASLDVSAQGSFCLPGAVGQTEVVPLQDRSYGSKYQSSGDSTTKAPYFHRPKYLCESSSDYKVHQHFAKVVGPSEFAVDQVTSVKPGETGHVSEFRGSTKTVQTYQYEDNDGPKPFYSEQGHIGSDLFFGNERNGKIKTLQNESRDVTILGPEKTESVPRFGLDKNQNAEVPYDVPPSQIELAENKDSQNLPSSSHTELAKTEVSQHLPSSSHTELASETEVSQDLPSSNHTELVAETEDSQDLPSSSHTELAEAEVSHDLRSSSHTELAEAEVSQDLPSSSHAEFEENFNDKSRAEDDDSQTEDTVFDDVAAENDPELQKDLAFYENNSEEGDDDLDIDRILRKCPPTEVLQHLRDMVQLSKNMTNQLERSLRKAARISCGPFPRLPGLSKDEVIDMKCCKLVDETEEFVGTINKNFMTFYQVVNEMDKVSAEQDSFVSSILVKMGPRDWRYKHAAIIKEMEKLWTRVYPKVITRAVTDRVPVAVHELNEETDD